MDSSITPLRHGGLSLVQTTDFFYPLVEDPYMQGKTHAQGIGTPPFDIQIPPYIGIKIPETFENQTFPCLIPFKWCGGCILLLVQFSDTI